MSSDGLLGGALASFTAALRVVRDAVASPAAFTAFLAEFGWTLSPADLASVTTSLKDLASIPDDTSSLTVEQLAAALVSGGTVIRKVASSGAPAAFASTFPRELLDWVVYSAVAQQGPPWLFGLLHLVGVLGERRVPADSATGRAEYTERLVRWELLSSLPDQPLATVEKSYGWGGAFDADGFLRSAGIVVRAFGGNAGMYGADRALVSQYYARNAPMGIGARNLIVSAPFLQESISSGGASAAVKLALLAIPIPPSAGAPAPADGLALMPVITGTATETLTLSDNVTLKLTGDFLTRPVRAEIHPGASAVRATPGDSHVDAAVRLDAKAPSSTPWLAFGDPASSRLEISAAHAVLGVGGQVDGELNLQVEVGLDSAALVIDLGEGDSFLQGSAGSGPARSPLSLVAKWSSQAGFSLVGQPRLGVTIPVDQSVGALARIESVGLALAGAAGDAVSLDFTLTFVATIGLVEVTITEAGVRALVQPVGDADPPGNLGNVDLQFGFKPPSGIGVQLDAPIMTGGGYLAHDPQQAQYAGAQDLLLQGTAVKAFGLIQTQLPGGLPGYSFIAVISAEFLPAIELPFGFSLDGVGGLIGINRSISQSAIETAVWAHHLDGLLFPKDPVASAPQLLSALDTYFPAAPGRYVVGPLVKIGWSANLVVGELAVLFELPEPLKILLIGDIQVNAPTAKPQLVLHISFDGGVDFGAKTAFFDASLHDSKIASYPISGDLAFRYGWGDNAVFALALGGFNPQFQPPASFPTLKRLAISISSSVAKLDTQAYLALTSNTLQFGARVELTAGTGGFNVHGWLGFDALFEKDPLSFEFDLSAGVDLRSGSNVLASVHLDGKLSGPTPWHISGSASLSLLFFDVSVHFDKTWGSVAGPVSVPDPLAAVTAALADRSGWSGLAIPGVRAAISPAGTPPDAEGAVLLDPAGALRIAQRAVPLDQPITRFGGVSLGRTVMFSVGAPSAFGQPGTTTEEFAPAQFLDLTDAEKLSLPSFSRFDAGIELGTGAVDLGHSSRSRAVLTPIAYDTTIIDSLPPPPTPPTPPPYRLGLAAALALNGSVGRLAPGLGRYAPAPGTPSRVALAADQWVVASTADLGHRADITSDGTKLGAHLALQQYLSANPGEAGGLQIVLASEAG